ncbi:claudin-7-like [Vanacampus margaritifer]
MDKIVMRSFLGLSLLGASGILYATIDGKWISLCELGLNCKYKKVEKSVGPWGACVYIVDDNNFSLCSASDPIVQDPIDNIPITSSLMVTSSVVGLVALAIAVTVRLCTFLGFFTGGFKKDLAVGIGGFLMIISGLFGLIVTAWISTVMCGREEPMTIKPPLYIAWVGVSLSLLGGIILTSYSLWKECCPRQVEPSVNMEMVDPAIPAYKKMIP